FLAILAADIRYQIIPDGAILIGTFFAFFKMWVDYRYTGMVNFLVFPSSLGAALFFLSLVLLTRGKGMGMGDVKLSFLMGLILGFPKIMVAVFLAFLTGALLGITLVLAGKKKLKDKVAFGPFLITGLVVALIWGQIIWEVYFYGNFIFR
ncbi:MAG: A24 family peptidase, partial [Candidatus Omnitrophica bacterium]|nr:A24 family peptidase [Candidatus Omnitrophota bacterium]